MDYGAKAKANHNMREAWQKGKSLKNASTKRTGSDLMAVLQRMVKLMVGAEHQMTIYLQTTSTQWTDHGLMVVLQQKVMPRVVAS